MRLLTLIALALMAAMPVAAHASIETAHPERHRPRITVTSSGNTHRVSRITTSVAISTHPLREIPLEHFLVAFVGFYARGYDELALRA